MCHWYIQLTHHIWTYEHIYAISKISPILPCFCMFLSEAFGHCLAFFVLALSQEAQKLHNLAQKACEDREIHGILGMSPSKRGSYPLNFWSKLVKLKTFHFCSVKMARKTCFLFCMGSFYWLCCLKFLWFFPHVRSATGSVKFPSNCGMVIMSIHGDGWSPIISGRFWMGWPSTYHVLTKAWNTEMGDHQYRPYHISIYIYINIPMTISPGLIYHQYTMFWPWRISCFYIVSGPMRPWPLPPGVNGCRECLALLFWDYCGPTQEMSVDNNQMFFTQFKHVQTNGISPVSVDSHMILSN